MYRVRLRKRNGRTLNKGLECESKPLLPQNVLSNVYFSINQLILFFLWFFTVVMSLIMITTEMISTIGMCGYILIHPTPFLLFVCKVITSFG